MSDHGRRLQDSSLDRNRDHDYDEEPEELWPARPEISPGKRTLTSRLLPVYRDADTDRSLADTAADAVARAAGSAGQPLPDEVRARFEKSLGVDLSGVRVHTDEAAARAAGDLRARAYTQGQDIFFATGKYDPFSHDGQALLAHEVVHTVQQRGAAPVAQRSLEVSRPGDALEVEADALSGRMARGERVAVGNSPPPITRAATGIYRWDEGQLQIANSDRQSIEQDLEFASRSGRAAVREILQALRSARRRAPAVEELVTVNYQGSQVRRVRPEDLDPLIARAEQYLRPARGGERAAADDGAQQDGQSAQRDGGGRQGDGTGGAPTGTTDPNAQERTRRSATGHWRTSSGADVTLALNQAGTHVRGRYQAHERDPDDLLGLDPNRQGRMRLNMGTITAELESDDVLETVFRFEGNPTSGRDGQQPFSGTIRVRNGPLLFLSRDNGDSYRFVRSNREAARPEQAAEDLDQSAREDVRQPLSDRQRERVERDAGLLRGVAQDFVNSEFPPTQNELAGRMDSIVRDAFEQVPQEQHGQLRQELRRRLAGLQVQANSRAVEAIRSRVQHGQTPTMDALEVLRMMAWRFERRSSGARSLLQLERPAGGDRRNPPPYFYRMCFGLVGLDGRAGAGAGVHIGVARVEQVAAGESGEAPGENARRIWGPVSYGMIRGRIHVGPSAGANVGETTAWKTSQPAQQRWTSSDIPGPFVSYGVQAGVRASDNGPVLEAGQTHLLGRGSPFEPLVFRDLGLTEDAVLGVGAGATGTAGGGALVGPRGTGQRPGSNEGPQNRRVQVVVSDQEVIGFDTDVSQLNAAGREALRRLCASNLALLEDSETVVRIDAYASRLASEAHNERLTQLRARNTRAAMQAMIGSRATGHFEIEGHGERAAAAAGVRDGDDSPEWRRVDVTINGTLALRLRASRRAPDPELGR